MRSVSGERTSSGILRGLYIGKYLPPPWGRGKISADVIWGKNMKRGREKGGKCKRKRKKEERKRKKGERKRKKGERKRKKGEGK